MTETEAKMQPLSGGGWFEINEAREFVQDAGLAHKHEPERLYFTRKANWVLYSRQNVADAEFVFVPVGEGTATHWLLTMMDWRKLDGQLGSDLKALFASTEV